MWSSRVGREVVRVCVAACLIVATTAGTLAAAPPTRAADEGPRAWRRQVVALMNDAREDRDLAPFRLNHGLSRSALAHTRRMIAEHRVFRTANVDELVEGYGAELWGELLARGRFLGGTVRAWLRHADTRRHLLDPRLSRVAIGVMFASGRYWVTVYLHD